MSSNQTLRNMSLLSFYHIILTKKTTQKKDEEKQIFLSLVKVADCTAKHPRHISACVNQLWYFDRISTACASQGHCPNSSHIQTKV